MGWSYKWEMRNKGWCTCTATACVRLSWAWGLRFFCSEVRQFALFICTRHWGQLGIAFILNREHKVSIAHWVQIENSHGRRSKNVVWSLKGQAMCLWGRTGEGKPQITSLQGRYEEPSQDKERTITGQRKNQGHHCLPQCPSIQIISS